MAREGQRSNSSALAPPTPSILHHPGPDPDRLLPLSCHPKDTSGNQLSCQGAQGCRVSARGAGRPP